MPYVIYIVIVVNRGYLTLLFFVVNEYIGCLLRYEITTIVTIPHFHVKE